MAAAEALATSNPVGDWGVTLITLEPAAETKPQESVAESERSMRTEFQRESATSYVLHERKTYSFKSPAAETVSDLTPSPAAAPAVAGAKGTVLNVQEESVLCEVVSDSGPVQIFVQRCHFPEDVSLGMPVLIAMRESNGIRAPHITKRELEPRNDALQTELGQLIASW